MRAADAATVSHILRYSVYCDRAEEPRSKLSSSMAVCQPLPSPPSTSVTGQVASVKKTSPNSLAPLICFSGRASTPFCFMSTSSMEMPWCFFSPPPVRARVKILSPCMALVVQIFWPLRTYSSPCFSAFICSAARSEPAPGSEKPWHQMVSQCSSGLMISRFCSSVPSTMTVGPRNAMPSGLTVVGAFARTISSS